MSFALTKLQAPRQRPGTIARPELEQRLGAALATRKLVLLSAPAGFGKTVALARQLGRLPAGSAAAWISCDEDDNLQRLLACLVAALEPFDLPWRCDPDTLAARTADSRVQRRAVTDELLNALDACDVARGIIVFDDLQRIEDPGVFEFIDMLLAGLPAHWVLVMATREPPPLSLARLRVQDELAEFRESDLRFVADEVDALVRATPGAAARVAAAPLLARTQGWAVGLRLALDRAAGVRGDLPALRSAALDRQVFDYLASEVLDDMPAELRLFLLRCAVLPELSVERCSQVSGDARAARWLERIDERGLFVSALEGPQLTLRLHDLFRDFLEDRLARELPHELPELRRRAAVSEPDPLRRVDAWLRAGEWATAEALLERIADDSAAAGASAAVLALCERFAPAWRERSVRLPLLQARLRWDWDRAAQAAATAAQVLGGDGDTEGRRQALAHQAAALAGANRGVEARRVLATLRADPGLQGDALLRALRAAAWVELAGGEAQAVAPVWSDLMRALENETRLAAWSACAPLPVFVGLPGMAPLLRRFVDGARRRLPEQATPLRASCTLIDAWLALWAGQADAAGALAAAAADDNRWLARAPGLDAPTRTLQAVLLALQGERESTRVMAELIDDVGAGAVGFRAGVYVGLYEHLAMRCAALAGDELTQRHMAERQLAPGQDHRGLLLALRRRAAAAVLAQLDGRLEQAADHWQALLDDAGLGDLYGLRIEAGLRLAGLRLALGRPPAQAAAALDSLWPTLDADGDGVLWLAGPALLDRLARTDWGAALGAQRVARLARAATQARALRHAGAAPCSSTLLTARESEVLAHIAAGESNKLIARAFDLSPHTVKRHVANILDKLGLQTRGQAAAWLRANRG